MAIWSPQWMAHSYHVLPVLPAHQPSSWSAKMAWSTGTMVSNAYCNECESLFITNRLIQSVFVTKLQLCSFLRIYCDFKGYSLYKTSSFVSGSITHKSSRHTKIVYNQCWPFINPNLVPSHFCASSQYNQHCYPTMIHSIKLWMWPSIKNSHLCLLDHPHQLIASTTAHHPTFFLSKVPQTHLLLSDTASIVEFPVLK